MHLRVGTPIWLVRKDSRRSRYPSLAGKHDADVVIVGGGLTGAAVAHVFAEAGIRAVLLEAERVSSGSTAASTALLMQETDETLGALAHRYGTTRARRIWELNHEGTRDLIDTLRRLRVPVDERETIYYSTSDVGTLRKECDLRRRAGFSASWMSAAQLRVATGLAGDGAIRSHGNAQCDPVRATAALLRSASRNGAHIFEASRATRIEPTRDGVIVRTPRGSISAIRVIIATGYATREFRPLAARFRMKHTYVLATARLSRRQRQRLGLDEVLLWDTARPYHYARWTDDNRLLLGGNDRPVVPARQRRRALAESTSQLHEHFVSLLPALTDVAIERVWEGLFAMTPDGLPFVGPHRRYPRHLFALGYGGNGMTFGFLAARLLLDAFLGVPNPDLELLAFNRSKRSG